MERIPPQRADVATADSDTKTLRGQGLSDQLWPSMLASGVLAVIVGIMVLVWPGLTHTVVSSFFGLYLLTTGIAQLFYGSAMHASAARFMLFASGATSLILALLEFLLARYYVPTFSVLGFNAAVFLAVGFILRGGAQTGGAVTNHDLPGHVWHIFLGVISLIAGISLLAYPFDSSITLALVAGLWFIVIGIAEIVSAFRIKASR